MLQDIVPHIYHNQMSWKEPEADDFVLCYRGRTLYCKVEDGSLVLPRVKDVEPSALQYAFSIDERADYLLSDAESSARSCRDLRSWLRQQGKAYIAGTVGSGSAAGAESRWKRAGSSGQWSALRAAIRSTPKSARQ